MGQVHLGICEIGLGWVFFDLTTDIGHSFTGELSESVMREIPLQHSVGYTASESWGVYSENFRMKLTMFNRISLLPRFIF